MFYHDSMLDTTSKIVIKETFSFHEFVVRNNLKKTDKLFHCKHGLNYLICCMQYSGYQLCVFLNMWILYASSIIDLKIPFVVIWILRKLKKIWKLARPVPNACAQPYHQGHGSHEKLFTLIRAHVFKGPLLPRQLESTPLSPAQHNTYGSCWLETARQFSHGMR